MSPMARCLELSRPRKETQTAPTWVLMAYNKKVLKGWAQLCQSTRANATNAYDWLARDAMARKPGRCFPLKHAKYAGHWCYEIGAGDRLYYKPDERTRTAAIWYAGKHPEGRIPDPPKAL